LAKGYLDAEAFEAVGGAVEGAAEEFCSTDLPFPFFLALNSSFFFFHASCSIGL
jgi:hypothetical protein